MCEITYSCIFRHHAQSIGTVVARREHYVTHDVRTQSVLAKTIALNQCAGILMQGAILEVPCVVCMFVGQSLLNICYAVCTTWRRRYAQRGCDANANNDHAMHGLVMACFSLST